MTRDAVLGLWLIGGFLFLVMGAAVVIIILSYKLGVYKGKLARYELAEKLSAAGNQTQSGTAIQS